MTYTAMAGSVAAIITRGIMSTTGTMITTGIMVGGATALGTGTQGPASMAAAPGMVVVGMVVAAGMLGAAGMVVVPGTVVAAEATVETEQRRRESEMNTILSPTGDPKRSLRDIASDLPGRLPIARWAPIPLRLIVGFGFMEHGFAKLFNGPDTFAAILQALAVPAPHFMAWVTILTEQLGGLAILLGAFVPLVSLPMAALLLVAIFTVHLPYGFSSIKLIAVTPTGAQFGAPGYECDLLYLASLVALVLGGIGPLAIDGLLRNRRFKRSSRFESLRL